MAGFKQGEKLDKLGHRGSNTGELIFDNCHVPCKYIMKQINRRIIAITIMYLKQTMNKR